MSQMKSATAILAFFALMTVVVTSDRSCTPETSVAEVEYKAKNSDILIYGYAKSKVRDSRFPKEDLYIVDFEVRCIFKGGPLQSKIRIQDVGKVDPMCEVSVMDVGKPLIVFLVKEGNRYVPSYKEGNGEPQFLDEVTPICGVTVRYPIGMTPENSPEICPDEWVPEFEEDECFSVEEPTTATAPTSRTDTDTDNSMDTNTESSDNTDGKEAPYQPVKSGKGDTSSSDNNKDVKIGDEASKGKKGAKKSENLEATTPGGRAGHTTASLLMSLGSLAVCLFVYFERV